MKILLIEDERELATSIKAYLSDHDILCEWAPDHAAAEEKIHLYRYDCILLDLMLPDGHGLDLLQSLKQQQKTDGVIIISAVQTLETRVEGLQLGADDYLIKPFHLAELLARIQALVRRRQFDGNNSICWEEITLDTMAHTVSVGEKEIRATRTEYDLLRFLIANAGKVVSKEAIAEHLSGDMADMLDNHDFIYAHMKNLKKKLRDAGATDYIQTVYGLGYRWTNG